MKKRKVILILLSGAVFLLVVSGSYTAWNRLDPDRTCALCHEIRSSHERWTTSAHAELHCIECHGTALSDGFHSLEEKINMVFSHFTQNARNEDIKLNERQILDVAGRCATCHAAEHAGWLRSGHAVTYGEIFMDSVHNTVEKPYWDCLRCHGMFYDGNIHDLMALDGADPADWKIRDEKQTGLPAVPCLACHRIHTENPVSERYVSMADTLGRGSARNPRTALYLRDEKMHLRSDYLTHVRMFDGDRQMEVSDDPNTWLCMQCHSPDYRHRAGHDDDRTVTGVHEGISCIACHRPHGGESRESCIRCHASLTEAQIQAVFAAPHTYRAEEGKL